MQAQSIDTRLREVRDRICAAAAASGRSVSDITLVAVSKTHDASAIQETIAAGQRCFGENRVQEAEAKFPGLKAATPGLRLHLIGPLQTNKVKEALRVADVIETLDRARLADAIAAAHAKSADTEEHRLPDLLIQINVGEEPQKAGILPGEADRFIAQCQERFGAAIIGLMCIPPVDEDPSRHFAGLAERAARHHLRVVSMGMSADYELAIRHGSTHVRVGSAIFGSRPTL